MKVRVVESVMRCVTGEFPTSIFTREVEIADHCPECGEPRGTPERRAFNEDGETLSLDCWTNPCGHLDTYAACLEEAARLKQTPRERIATAAAAISPDSQARVIRVRDLIRGGYLDLGGEA